MKYIKLLIIAALLVGAVSLLLLITQGGNSGSKAGVTSSCAKKFETEINDLCKVIERGKEWKWSQQAYKNLQNKINTFAKDGNLQPGEKNSLSLYLYTESCKAMFEYADKLFSQSSYPSDKVNSLESNLKFLESLKAGSNSNLTQGLNMLHEYRTVIACCSFSSNAKYSDPLKAFNAGTAETMKGRIQGMKYYKSHFCKNPEIRSKIENLSSNLTKAESEYYVNLERCVEEHYYSLVKKGIPKWQALDQAQKDYDRFKVISTNTSATSRLNNFINGNH